MIFTCYWCQKDIPNEDTKRCSRCLLVIYCYSGNLDPESRLLKSKECQTISWKTSHKQNCSIHPSLVSPDDPTKPLSKSDLRKDSPEYTAIQIDRDLSRWLQIWRACFYQWGILALDLANHPRDRVMTHCLTLFVQQRRRKVTDPSKRYGVVFVSVIAIAHIQMEYPGLEVNIDPTDFTRLRFVVVLQDENGDMIRVRLVQWNQRGLDHWRRIDKETSAALGAGRLEFGNTLIDSVNFDDPKVVEKKLGIKQ